MTREQAAAYIIAQAACATAEIAAMEAANANARRNENLRPPYDEQHFLAVPEKYGIHHNAVLATFQGANE